MRIAFVSVLAVAALALAMDSTVSDANTPPTSSPTFAFSSAPNPVAGNAQGQEFVLNGTLCAGGPQSFECKASPAFNSLATYRDSVRVKLTRGAISADEAQEKQNAANAVRAQLDSAVRTCAQNNHTGKCTGDSATAEKILKGAKAAVRKLR